MHTRSKLACFAATLGISALLATPSHSSLATFQTYTGNVGVSTDGASDGIGVLSASAPAGSTVVAAYLYTATFTFGGPPDISGVTLNGTSVAYGPSFPNPTACCSLSSHRSDVTAIVAPVINGGGGGVYNFSYAEGGGSGNIDGSALVVVYSNPALSTATVGILNGAASVTGDTATISFANGLAPGDPSFFADMYLGIGFSTGNSQVSTVDVNGQLMTSVAGGFDDGALANGSLITMGGFNDPYTVAAPGTPANNSALDNEKYNLIPFINPGDTSIVIATANSSQDDNIFVAVFHVDGEARISSGEVPLPAAVWMFGAVAGGAGFWMRRRRQKLTPATA